MLIKHTKNTCKKKISIKNFISFIKIENFTKFFCEIQKNRSLKKVAFQKIQKKSLSADRNMPLVFTKIKV